MRPWARRRPPAREPPSGATPMSSALYTSRLLGSNAAALSPADTVSETRMSIWSLVTRPWIPCDIPPRSASVSPLTGSTLVTVYTASPTRSDEGPGRSARVPTAHNAPSTTAASAAAASSTIRGDQVGGGCAGLMPASSGADLGQCLDSEVPRADWLGAPPARECRGDPPSRSGLPLSGASGQRYWASTMLESADEGLVPTPFRATTRNRYRPAGSVMRAVRAPAAVVAVRVTPVAVPFARICTAVTV